MPVSVGGLIIDVLMPVLGWGENTCYTSPHQDVGRIGWYQG